MYDERDPLDAGKGSERRMRTRAKRVRIEYKLCEWPVSGKAERPLPYASPDRGAAARTSVCSRQGSTALGAAMQSWSRTRAEIYER